MATYTPESLKIKAPTTGFQQGGWYNGRQYWGGTLSEPGQIHPASNQQGAGQNVDNAVIAQTNPNNVAYIEAQRAQASANPTTPAQTYSTPNQGLVSTPTQSTGSSMTGGYSSVQTPAINLPDLYSTLYSSSGISDLQKTYSDQEKAFIEAKAKINDNPFLSEASRVGREAKLTTLFNDRTANLKNDIAMRKADVETQMNLQLKQFDINSQQAQNALSQFNTLLSMGALNNASGEDIANITRSTGISSSMIQGAINASKAKNVKTSLKTFTDNNGNVSAVIIDENTGAIVKQTSLGQIDQSKKATTETAKEKTAGIQAQFITALDGIKNSYGHIGKSDWDGAMSSWISRGGSKSDFIKNFSQYTDPNRGDFKEYYGFDLKDR